MSDEHDCTKTARALLDHPADWPGEVVHFRRETAVLLDEIERLRTLVRFVSESRQRLLDDAARAITETQDTRDVSIFALTRRVDYLMNRLRDLGPTAAVLSAFRARYAGPLSEGVILDDVIDALKAACQSGRVAGNGESDHRGEMEGASND